MLDFVFIGGCPRSGTTLLAAMLGNSQHTVALPEGPFKFQMIESLNQHAKPDAAKVTAIVRKAQRHYSYKHWDLDISAEEIVGSIDWNSPVFPQVYGQMASNYVNRHYPEKRTSARTVIDNDPANCKHGHSLSAFFPDALFVHVIRDGRAVAASVMQLDWGPNDIFSAAVFWLTNLAYGFRCEETFGKSRSVKYETLVASPREVMSDLALSLNVPFSDSMLSPSGVLLPAYTRAQHQLIGGPLAKQQIDAWRQRLTPAEIGYFQKETHEMLVMLGYAPENVDADISDLDKIRLKAWGRMRNYVNKVMKKKREQV